MSKLAGSTALTDINAAHPDPNPTPAHRQTRKPYFIPTILLVLTIFICYLYARSYTAVNKELGTWGCRMSWMAPNYIRMDGPEVESGLSRKYGVYLYREGGLQDDVRVSLPWDLFFLFTVVCTIFPF
jgi:hypothetical protein